MSVETITSAAVSTASSSSSSATTGVDDMGFDTFIQLLVTQLQNQDPLNPMDGTEFTAQLATFSQLEQTMQSNDYLEKLVTGSDYSTISLAVSYIGNEVLSPMGNENDALTIDLPEDGEMTVVYNLTEEAYSNTIKIYDEDGTLVRTLDGATSDGLNTTTWDGNDEDGEHVPAGQYTFVVEAVSGDGEDITHQFYAFSEVLGVAGEEGDIILSLADGRDVNFDDVVQVRGVN